MSRCRVAMPTVVRLPLSDGDFIDVKKRLSAGEYFEMLQAQANRDGFAKLLTYIVGWSLCGPNNAPLPYSPDLSEAERRTTLRGLEDDTWSELIAAVTAHEAKEDAEREAKKLPPTRAGSPISPSPVGVDGPLTRSEPSTEMITTA